MQGGILNIFLLMALIGYVTFVFIGEGLNPFRPPRNTQATGSKRRRRRYWFGLITGLLVALSSLAVKFFPVTGLLSELKVSLLTAFFLLLPFLFYVILVEKKQKQTQANLHKKDKVKKDKVKKGEEIAESRSARPSGAGIDNLRREQDHLPSDRFGDDDFDDLDSTLANENFDTPESVYFRDPEPAKSSAAPQLSEPGADFHKSEKTRSANEIPAGLENYADPQPLHGQAPDHAAFPGVEHGTSEQQALERQALEQQVLERQALERQESERRESERKRLESLKLEHREVEQGFRVKMSDLESKLQNQETTISNLQVRLTESEKLNSQLESKLSQEETVQQELLKKEQQALALMAENEKIAPLESEVAALRNVSLQLQEKEGEVQRLQKRLDVGEKSSVSELQSLRQENEKLSLQLDEAMDAANRQTEKSVEDLEIFSDLQRKFLDKEQELVSIEKLHTQNQSRLQSLEHELGQSREHADSLQDKLAEAQRWKSEASESKSKLVSLNSRIDELQQRATDEALERNQRISQLETELGQARDEHQEMKRQLSVQESELVKRMQLLDKNRDIARNATIAARKAAVAHKSAKEIAMRERQSRLKMELSAKRAVNIARDAIGKLSQHENRVQ